MMPKNLVIVRHGESEGNVVKQNLFHGDGSLYTEKFKERHDANYRLSKLGVYQSKIAGEYIKENFGENFFDAAYTSYFIRAIETGCNLDLDIKWRIRYELIERDWGELGTLSPSERDKKFPDWKRIKNEDPLFWRPQGGERMIDVQTRVKQFIGTLHRQHTEENVLVVCHGEVSWGFRLLLESISPMDYKILDQSKKEFDRIHNCQILHYTRINPILENQEPSKKLEWIRSICPWDDTKSSNKWQHINQEKKYSTEDLKAMYEKVPRIFSDF